MRMSKTGVLIAALLLASGASAEPPPPGEQAAGGPAAPPAGEEAPQPGQDAAQDRVVRIMGALDLPAMAQSLRANVYEEEVDEALKAARDAGLPAASSREMLNAAQQGVMQHGKIENFGEYVKAQLEEGKRGRDLSEAIKAEHQAKGSGPIPGLGGPAEGGAGAPGQGGMGAPGGAAGAPGMGGPQGGGAGMGGPQGGGAGMGGPQGGGAGMGGPQGGGAMGGPQGGGAMGGPPGGGAAMGGPGAGAPGQMGGGQ